MKPEDIEIIKCEERIKVLNHNILIMQEQIKLCKDRIKQIKVIRRFTK